jgi:hypothetical protein
LLAFIVENGREIGEFFSERRSTKFADRKVA